MSFLTKKTKRTYAPRPSSKEARTGKMVTPGWSGRPPAPKPDLPTPSTIGSVDWCAQQVYGSVGEFINFMESIALSADSSVDLKWRRFFLLYKYWEQEYRAERLESAPTLEQVCAGLKISGRELWAFIADVQRTMFSNLAIQKAQLAAPGVIDSMIAASKDVEAGAKDRAALLEIAGVKSAAAGIQVNVSQQVLVTPEDKTPLLQFRETVDMIDATARQALKEPLAIEGDIVADFVDQKLLEPIKDQTNETTSDNPA